MKKLLFCTHKLNRANIRRETREGVEHIILTSFTLPPDSVMNGGFYSAEEIDKSFETLNRTPATIEHPSIGGVFVSANDPEIDMDFRIGSWNENARKVEDGRVALDKVINVQKAMMTEKGKRLLDRIKEIETNENARPIHSSVGVFLEAEDVELSINERGQEYTWLAKDMIFDHDAYLIDSIGASTPDQGTGIGVNKENVKVEHYVCSGIKKKIRKVKASNFLTNELSFSEIENQLWQAINQGLEKSTNWVVAVFDDTFIFETESNELFKSNYVIDELDNLSIQDTRLPVERVVEFKPINPTETQEDSAMRDQIIAELVKLGITVNADISDADLGIQYKEALTVNKDENADDKKDDNLLANSIKELTDKVSSLETKLTANSDKELDSLATSIVSSKMYPNLDESDIKSLGLDKAKAMAANCGVSHSVGSTMLNNDDNAETFKTNVEDLPE